MEYKAYISRLSVDEITIAAKSRTQAMDKLRQLAATDKEASTVLHYALAKRNRVSHIQHHFKPQNTLSLKAARPPHASAADVLRFLADELSKSWIVIEALATACLTTEDLAIEQDSSVGEVLASRDYEGEYDAFMHYIVSARRALNLPDVLVEADEQSG